MTARVQADEPAVIELGAGWREPLAERERDFRGRPRLLALVLAAVLALALGGAGPVTRLRELARITLTSSAADFRIFSDLLVVHDGDRLDGYRLADGTPAWRVAFPQAVDGANILAPLPGIALVSLESVAGKPFTAVVDTVRGAVLWQIDASLGSPNLAPDVVLIEDDREAGAFTVRDVRTGRVRWAGHGRVASPLDAVPAAGADPPQALWTVSPAGVLTQRDLRDGRVLRTGRVDLRGGEPRFVVVLGAELFIEVAVGTGDESRQVRLDTATLAAVPATRPFVRRFDCGAHWCVVSQDLVNPDEASIEVVDKATGAQRQRIPANTLVEPARWGLLLGGFEVADRGIRLDSMIDAGTGRELADLGGWQLLQDQPRPAEVLLRGPADGPVQVARLTPTGPEVVAELPGVVGRCAFAQQRLACLDDALGLTLWRMPA
ncbi:hypothetical protein [Catellatospora sp. NPDC049609]|uniref:hypothetical protein n=1 Tax=Catellatospora sp. NPDC049609 TaxID=3155505 RepID=UPI003449D24F